MRSITRFLPTLALSALLPVSAAVPMMADCEQHAEGCEHALVGQASGGPALLAQGSALTAATSPLANLLRNAIGSLMGVEPEPPSADEELAAKVARVSDKVKAAPKLTFEHTRHVDEFVKYYTEGRGRRTMQVGIARSEGMRERAAEIFAEEGVPVELVWLAQVESVWRNDVSSQVGASGVWQFMPATAERFGLECHDELDERADFEKSTRAAARYLRILAKRYDGNWELAIGAYNFGEGNMDKAIERAGAADFWTLVEKDVLPEETKDYVPKVLAAAIIGSQLGLSNG